MSSNRPIKLEELIKAKEKYTNKILEEKKDPVVKSRVIDSEEIQSGIKPMVQEQIHRHIIEHAEPKYSEDKILHGKINKVALARYLFPLCAGTFTGGMLYAWGGLVPVIVTVFIFIGIIGAVMSS